MKQRFILFRRNGTYYCEDTTTRKQASLKTKDEGEALVLLNAKNESYRQPVLNIQIARTYLTASDPNMGERTWQVVMNEMQTHGKEATRKRCLQAMKGTPFDHIRRKKLLETTAEDFLTVLKCEQVSVAHYLRRLHNLALGLGWLVAPVLHQRHWPKIQFKPKRSITPGEHQRILAAEKNPERNLFYQLLWEIGSSQSDAALLAAENIDWSVNKLSYSRMKTGTPAQLTIGKNLAGILVQLPKTGPLFPGISKTTDNARSAEFNRRCKLLRISGITLHSYRYAWAERAKICGYPERFTQEALGHNSKAVHRAYSKNAQVVIPALEDYETKCHSRNGATETLQTP